MTQKTSIKINSRPGQHGSPETKTKRTEYGVRLEEKQKLKFNYGLSEKHLYRYIKKSRKSKGITGIVLLQLLEMRLDTLCFALGFGRTIGQARQIVNHGHITLNQDVVSIPSFQCKVNDIIGIKEKETAKTLILTNLKNHNKINLPNHLKFDNKKIVAKVLNYCDRNDVLLQIKELLVIEYYSSR